MGSQESRNDRLVQGGWWSGIKKGEEGCVCVCGVFSKDTPPKTPSSRLHPLKVPLCLEIKLVGVNI